MIPFMWILKKVILRKETSYDQGNMDENIVIYLFSSSPFRFYMFLGRQTWTRMNSRSNQPDAGGATYTINKLLQDKSFQQQLPKLIEQGKMRSSEFWRRLESHYLATG